MQDILLPASSYLPNLTLLLEQRDLRQFEVAASLGRSQGIVSDWVSGRVRVPSYVLPRLATLLDLSLPELLVQGSEGWVPPMAPPPAPEPSAPPELPRHPVPVKIGTIDPFPMVRSPVRLCWGCPVHPKGLVR